MWSVKPQNLLWTPTYEIGSYTLVCSKKCNHWSDKIKSIKANTLALTTTYFESPSSRTQIIILLYVQLFYLVYRLKIISKKDFICMIKTWNVCEVMLTEADQEPVFRNSWRLARSNLVIDQIAIFRNVLLFICCTALVSFQKR